MFGSTLAVYSIAMPLPSCHKALFFFLGPDVVYPQFAGSDNIIDIYIHSCLFLLKGLQIKIFHLGSDF